MLALSFGRRLWHQLWQPLDIDGGDTFQPFVGDFHNGDFRDTTTLEVGSILENKDGHLDRDGVELEHGQMGAILPSPTSTHLCDGTTGTVSNLCQ